MTRQTTQAGPGSEFFTRTRFILPPVAKGSLVAWYPFRSGTGEDITAGDSDFGDTTDYSATVNGATFKASGGVTDIETGANSGAFGFDGTDDDMLNTSGVAPSGDTDITITGFVNPDVIKQQFLVSFGTDNTASRFSFAMDAGNSSHNLRYENGGDFSVSSLTVPTGQFSFVSCVYKTGGNVEFQLGTQTDTGTIQANNLTPNSLNIGSRDGSSFFFDGICDGIRIYTTELSKSQRETIRQNTKP